jgi:8-oxo-dGTP diphosphatase
MQQLLDTMLEQASASAQERFMRLLAADSAALQERNRTGAQALRVAIAIVVRGEEVLLVCRRSDDAESITWQFPAGVVKPGARPDVVAVRETLAETGVRCTVQRELGNRIHPVTGVLCDYLLCDYLAGEATNSDMVENADVVWTPHDKLTRFIPAERIFPPVLKALEERYGGH